MEVSSSLTGPWKPISTYYFWRATTDPAFTEVDVEQDCNAHLSEWVDSDKYQCDVVIATKDEDS